MSDATLSTYSDKKIQHCGNIIIETVPFSFEKVIETFLFSRQLSKQFIFRNYYQNSLVFEQILDKVCFRGSSRIYFERHKLVNGTNVQ